MARRVFLAGATGAVGRPLLGLLQEAGHEVMGMTRSAERAAALRTRGVAMVEVDVFDAAALAEALGAFRPDVVIHQLTDLPSGLDPALMQVALRRNARIRDEGTRNLVAAARAAGAARLVAQSIAWAYAAGPLPHAETDPLDSMAEGDRAVSVRGVIALETQVLDSGMGGLVLRYGRLYGPGTGVEAAPSSLPLHVEDAARAALLAIERGESGPYNIADYELEVSLVRARRELGFVPRFDQPQAGRP